MKISFDIAKVTRALRTHGCKFTFLQPVLDQFNEPTQETKHLEILGLFHQTRGWISISTSDGTAIQSKPQPQILTPINDSSNQISQGDTLKYCGKLYKVSGIDNIGNLNIAYDISLELVLDGT